MSIFDKIGKWVKRAGDLGLPPPDPASDAGDVAEQGAENKLPGQSDSVAQKDAINADGDAGHST